MLVTSVMRKETDKIQGKCCSYMGGRQCLLNTKGSYQKRKELFLIQEVIVNNRGRKRTPVTVETTLKVLQQTSLHPHSLVYRSKSHIDHWVLNLAGVSRTSFMFLLISLRKQNHALSLSSVFLDVCLYKCAQKKKLFNSPLVQI